jgi:spermidine synthase
MLISIQFRGMGVGVSARVLMKDGVLTTVVEIDPLVYEYAQTYFGFPTPDGGVFLEDARIYLHRQARGEGGDFDYVIHDVFTGGSVPSSLFTLECWQAIRARLKDDGVLAVVSSTRIKFSCSCSDRNLLSFDAYLTGNLVDSHARTLSADPLPRLLHSS